MKKFYGILFQGGNRTCTTGTPNKITGRMSIACEIYVFKTQDELDKFMENEDLYKPSGLGGGERISVKKSELRKYKNGLSMDEFLEELKYAENRENF